MRNVPSTLSATCASLLHASPATHQSAGHACSASVLFRTLPTCVINAWVRPVHATFHLEEVEVHMWSSSCRQNSLALCDQFHCDRDKNVELTNIEHYCLCSRDVVKSALIRRAQVDEAHRQRNENHTSHIIKRMLLRKTILRRDIPTNRTFLEQQQSFESMSEKTCASVTKQFDMNVECAAV